MLRIYTSPHCPACARTLALAERLRALRPALDVALIDINDPAAEVPPSVIGTPMYTWNHQALFWGNPAEAELFERVDALYGQS
jgi:hypothetical protein